jgi:hypothetical protein
VGCLGTPPGVLPAEYPEYGYGAGGKYRVCKIVIRDAKKEARIEIQAVAKIQYPIKSHNG